jgi:hypothetical protein
MRQCALDRHGLTKAFETSFCRSSEPRLSAGLFDFAIGFRYRAGSATAVAAVLAAALLTAALLIILAGVLGLLAGLLSATLLLAGPMLAALLLLVATLTLTRVLWVLIHGRSPVAQPPDRHPAGQNLRRLERFRSNCPRWRGSAHGKTLVVWQLSQYSKGSWRNTGMNS